MAGLNRGFFVGEGHRLGVVGQVVVLQERQHRRADLDPVAVLQFVADDGLPVDERAGAAAGVGQHVVAVFVFGDPGVQPGDGRVDDDHPVRQPASDQDPAVNHPAVAGAFVVVKESGHALNSNDETRMTNQ